MAAWLDSFLTCGGSPVTETKKGIPPHSAGDGQEEYNRLFDAPDFSSFVRRPKTATAREYEKKMLSLLKAGMLGAINSQSFPDAAAIIAHGPAFAAAVGDLADQDEKAKRIFDLITAPANPYAMFLMTVVPFVSQLLRNHEPVLAELGNKDLRKARKAARKAQDKVEDSRPQITVKLPFGRKLTFRVKVRKPGIWKKLRTQTQDPRALTIAVFSDQKVRNYLAKQGIQVVQQQQNTTD